MMDIKMKIVLFESFVGRAPTNDSKKYILTSLYF